MGATLFARTEHKGVTITVYLRDTKAMAALVRGDLVEHHVIEHNPMRAIDLSKAEALRRAKGLLK